MFNNKYKKLKNHIAILIMKATKFLLASQLLPITTKQMTSLETSQGSENSHL